MREIVPRKLRAARRLAGSHETEREGERRYEDGGLHEVGAGRLEPPASCVPNAALYQAELRPGRAQCRAIACRSMVDAAVLPAEPGRPDDRRGRGYLMVATAAILFALNGTVSKVALGSELTSVDLTQIRSTGAAVGLLVFLLLFARHRLRASPRELAFLAAFGVTGVAFVQWLYFVAIERLPVGIALLIQFTGPLIIALFAWLVYHEHIRRRIWVALALCLVGLAVIVEIWTGLAFDTLGIAAAFAAAFALAAYVLMAERARKNARPGLALVLRLPLRGALLGGRPAALAVPVEHARRVRLAPGEVRGADGARVAAGRVRGRGRDDDHVLPAHGGSYGTSRRRARPSSGRSSRSSRPSSPGSGSERPSAPRSSSAARSCSPGILLAQTAR